MAEERLDVLAQSVIVPAGRIEKSAPAIERDFRCRSKNLSDFTIPFRRHCSFLRSIRAAARTEPDANHFVSFAQTPSTLQRFPLRSDRQRSATRQPGFAVHQVSIGR